MNPTVLDAEEADQGGQKNVLHFIHKGVFTRFSLYNPQKCCAIILWRNQSW